MEDAKYSWYKRNLISVIKLRKLPPNRFRMLYTQQPRQRSKATIDKLFLHNVNFLHGQEGTIINRLTIGDFHAENQLSVGRVIDIGGQNQSTIDSWYFLSLTKFRLHINLKSTLLCALLT